MSCVGNDIGDVTNQTVFEMFICNTNLMMSNTFAIMSSC